MQLVPLYCNIEYFHLLEYFLFFFSQLPLSPTEITTVLMIFVLHQFTWLRTLYKLCLLFYVPVVRLLGWGREEEVFVVPMPSALQDTPLSCFCRSGVQRQVRLPLPLVFVFILSCCCKGAQWKKITFPQHLKLNVFNPPFCYKSGYSYIKNLKYIENQG